MMIIDEELFTKIKQITGYEYDFYQVNNEEDDVMIRDERIMEMLEDLVIEVDRRDEELEDLKEDMEQNYKSITREEELI